MDLINFLVWLTAGAIIGWFANRMVMTQHERQIDKPTPSQEENSGDG